MPASAWLACAGAGLARGGLSGQGGDLDEVVGENRVPAPDRRSVPAVQAGAVPAVAAFEVADPSFPSQCAILTSRWKPRLCSIVLRAGEVLAWRGIATVRTPRVCRSRSTAGWP